MLQTEIEKWGTRKNLEATVEELETGNETWESRATLEVVGFVNDCLVQIVKAM